MKKILSLISALGLLTVGPAFATQAPFHPHEADIQRLAETLEDISTTEMSILDGATVTTSELNILDTVTATASDLNLLDQTNNATNVGAVGSAPASGTWAASIERYGPFFTLTITATAGQLAVTDGAGAGSYASDVIFDFVEGGVQILGCRQNYTAFAEGAALTGAAGDAVFEIGVGSTAISSAADGTLGATEDDICGDVNVTLSGGTGTGTLHTGAAGPFDGTGTASTLNLNWSGTAATIDANSTIDVTGVMQVVGVFLGDD